jgi:biopolymer transport protein TolR
MAHSKDVQVEHHKVMERKRRFGTHDDAHPHSGAMSDINITPLIDVLLVILIIFMIVVPVTPTKLDASLPQQPTGPTPSPAPTGLVLEVRADAFTLNTTPFLTRAALAERLRAAFVERRDPTVFVKVEGGVAYDRVIEALDIAREAGAGRIGLVDEADAVR